MSAVSETLFSQPSNDEALAQHILVLLNDLKFGSLEIVVHEGHIVQIEKREKIRLNLKKRG